MKRILAFALCAAFACQAGARTFYVDASRPNNNGNGLKVKTAKKTIQAAVNAAAAGDTIVVLPGNYASFKTNNKKIVIKSQSGAKKTKIRYKGSNRAVALLGKTWTDSGSYVDSYGQTHTWTSKSDPMSKGTATALVGFTADGDGYSILSGGTVKSCILQNMYSFSTYGAVYHSKLAACKVQNSYLRFDSSSLSRCSVQGNDGSYYDLSTLSTFCDCLFAGNETLLLKGCTLVNCTVADNQTFAMNKTKAYNTVFNGVGAAQFKAAKKNSFANCYKGAAPGFIGSGDYRLAKGSRLIDKGKVSAALAKLYGTKDLVGNKRVKGKSIDIGCYEY